MREAGAEVGGGWGAASMEMCDKLVEQSPGNHLGWGVPHLSSLVAIVGCEVDERRTPLDSITSAVLLAINFDAYFERWRRDVVVTTGHGGAMGWCFSAS